MMVMAASYDLSNTKWWWGNIHFWSCVRSLQQPREWE